MTKICPVLAQCFNADSGVQFELQGGRTKQRNGRWLMLIDNPHGDHFLRK